MVRNQDHIKDLHNANHSTQYWCCCKAITADRVNPLRVLICWIECFTNFVVNCRKRAFCLYSHYLLYVNVNYPPPSKNLILRIKSFCQSSFSSSQDTSNLIVMSCDKHLFSIFSKFYIFVKYLVVTFCVNALWYAVAIWYRL